MNQIKWRDIVLEALQLFDIAACSIGGVFYTGAV
jgi:hypothetical protein